MNWTRGTEAKKAGPGPIETFEKELSDAISKAEKAGVLDLHIFRSLQSRAQYAEYRASIRNRQMGGR
jgi:hypothetical protein